MTLRQLFTHCPGRQGVYKKCTLYPTSLMGLLPLQCTLLLHKPEKGVKEVSHSSTLLYSEV